MTNETVRSFEIVSVVVPIYNVEKYLRRCIDSIVNQTYKNLDIILVDDGSPDSCGKICDEYQEKFNNIRVIHQENQGLSCARNRGLSVASGSYITFIDSDDWIATDMIESLLQLADKHQAEVAVAGFYNVYDTGKMVRNSKHTEIQILTNKEALECYLFSNCLTPCVCGKLWKTCIWEGVNCPPGKLFEDQYTTYKLLVKAETVVFNPLPQYYYYKRVDSIGHMAFSDKTYDLYEGIQEQYSYISSQFPEIESSIAIAKLMWELVFINMMLRSNFPVDLKLVSSSRLFARKRISDVYKCKFINGVRKIQITLFAYLFVIYKIFYLKYKKRNGMS
ncbi:MAG: glycosyltransferase family 2 protein [Hungatella sp.]